jgi:farnesyl-diphosphate farnesyltransferase
MLRTGESVKISRGEVKSLMVAGLALVMSNSGIRRLVARVRQRRFSLVPGASRA